MSVAHIGRNDDSSVIKNPRRITDGDFCNFISKYVILVSSELSRRSGAGFHAAHHPLPSQDFRARYPACLHMRERADRTLFVTAKRLSAQIGNTGFRRRLGVGQGDCRKTGPPSNAFHSLLPVGLLSFYKTRPPRQILPLNRNSISVKVFGRGGMFLRK